MDDRTLLEAAAKAAGIDATAYYGPSDEFWGLVVDSTGVEWNPLEDDGDALRLAYAVNASIQPKDGSDGPGQFGFFSWVEVRINGRPQLFKEFHAQNTGAEAATRRAIVRAAAAIGGAQL
jgi:hypothetical protein